MINSQDIKNGVCIRMDGRLYFVIEFLHVKPGKGNTINVLNSKMLSMVVYLSAASTLVRNWKMYA